MLLHYIALAYVISCNTLKDALRFCKFHDIPLDSNRFPKILYDFVRFRLISKKPSCSVGFRCLHDCRDVHNFRDFRVLRDATWGSFPFRKVMWDPMKFSLPRLPWLPWLPRDCKRCHKNSWDHFSLRGSPTDYVRIQNTLRDSTSFPWNSMRFFEIPWGSLIVHQIPFDSIRFCDSWRFRKIPQDDVGLHDIPWDSMRCHEIRVIPWNSSRFP